MSQVIQTVQVPALMQWLTQQASFQRMAGETLQASHTIRTREALRRALKKGLEQSQATQPAFIQPARSAIE